MRKWKWKRSSLLLVDDIDTGVNAGRSEGSRKWAKRLVISTNCRQIFTINY